MSNVSPTTSAADRGYAVLRAVEDRLLWLSTAIIHHANRVRPNPTGLEVGGHQASSASMVSIMRALWFNHLRRDDRVSVKPHVSPVLHAGQLPVGAPGCLLSPAVADYSTGSVGIGATAPIWGALSRRYVEGAFGGAGIGRQYSLVGDAELDEGAVWEAVAGQGRPQHAADKLRGTFTAAG